jgi:hypothetical protein
MRTFISIDWDFFLWRGCEAADPSLTVTVEGEERTTAGAGFMLFDWGHSEAQSPMLQSILWATRRQALERHNIDLETTAGINTDKGCTPVTEFCEDLRDQFVWSEDPEVLYSDSHALGAAAFWDIDDGDIERVVLFDAHHDLGYHNKDVDDAFRGNASCANWLLTVAAYNDVEIVFVYPDWADRPDVEGILERSPELDGRLKVYSWSEWKVYRDVEATVAGVNVARSGSWTPPWMDGAFQTLLKQLPTPGDRVCMDCSDEFPRVGAGDACKSRETIEIPTFDL